MATPECGETYQGGHTAHVGQLFFDDALSDQVFATEAYARDNEEGKLTNEEDTIFGDHGDEPGFLVAVDGSVDAGLTGVITIGADPTAVAAEGGSDGGGGGAPPDGGPGGPPPAEAHRRARARPRRARNVSGGRTTPARSEQRRGGSTPAPFPVPQGRLEK
jgi:hypothetical protein